MTAKTITAIVISITILFVLLVTKVGAEEVKQQILDLFSKVTNN